MYLLNSSSDTVIKSSFGINAHNNAVNKIAMNTAEIFSVRSLFNINNSFL